MGRWLPPSGSGEVHVNQSNQQQHSPQEEIDEDIAISSYPTPHQVGTLVLPYWPEITAQGKFRNGNSL